MDGRAAPDVLRFQELKGAEFQPPVQEVGIRKRSCYAESLERRGGYITSSNRDVQHHTGGRCGFHGCGSVLIQRSRSNRVAGIVLSAWISSVIPHAILDRPLVNKQPDVIHLCMNKPPLVSLNQRAR
jgi:hypothetical protein